MREPTNPCDNRCWRPWPRPRRLGLGVLALLVMAAALAAALAGCLRVSAPAATDRLPVTLDDPRVDVRAIERGEQSPLSGVVMNRWTFEALLEAAQGHKVTRSRGRE